MSFSKPTLLFFADLAFHTPEPRYTLPCILAWRYVADGDDAFFVKNPRILNDRLVRLEKSTRRGVTLNKRVQNERP